jgi:hypothetical protein
MDDDNEFYYEFLMPALEKQFRQVLETANEQENWFASRAAQNALDRLLEAQFWYELAGPVEWLEVEYVEGDDDAE